MDEDILKKLKKDEDGLLTYEYIANNLNAIDKKKYASGIDTLVKAAIERDREHKYIPDLLSSLWGADYNMHVDELNAKDDNFRRIYKRVYQKGI